MGVGLVGRGIAGRRRARPGEIPRRRRTREDAQLCARSGAGRASRRRVGAARDGTRSRGGLRTCGMRRGRRACATPRGARRSRRPRSGGRPCLWPAVRKRDSVDDSRTRDSIHTSPCPCFSHISDWPNRITSRRVRANGWKKYSFPYNSYKKSVKPHRHPLALCEPFPRSVLRVRPLPPDPLALKLPKAHVLLPFNQPKRRDIHVEHFQLLPSLVFN